MIKELFIAIALGAIIGFGVTSGFVAVNKSAQKAKITPTPTMQVIPSPVSEETKNEDVSVETESTSENKSDLNIDFPNQESVVATSKTTIKGTTKPNSIVIIKTATKTFNTNSDNNGTFNSEIDLESGVNIINITAIDTDDNQYENQLLVTYSTSKF